MTDRKTERVATGLTGAALVTGGVMARDHAIAGAAENYPKRLPMMLRKVPDAKILRASVPKKLLYTGGVVSTVAGAPAIVRAIRGDVPARHRETTAKRLTTSPDNPVLAGLQGEKDAFVDRFKPKRSKGQSARANLTGLAGAGGGWIGARMAAGAGLKAASQAPKSGWFVPNKLHKPAVAIAGITGATLAGAAARGTVKARQEHKLVKDGAKRSRTKPIPASSKATSYEGRPNRGGSPMIYRHQTVTKGDPSANHVPTTMKPVAKPRYLPGMSAEESRVQIKDKKLKQRLSNASSALGVASTLAGTAAAVGSSKSKWGKPLKPFVNHLAAGTAVAGLADFGLDGLSTVKQNQIFRRDIKASQVVGGILHDKGLGAKEPAKKSWQQVPSWGSVRTMPTKKMLLRYKGLEQTKQASNNEIMALKKLKHGHPVIRSYPEHLHGDIEVGKVWEMPFFEEKAKSATIPIANAAAGLWLDVSKSVMTMSPMLKPVVRAQSRVLDMASRVKPRPLLLKNPGKGVQLKRAGKGMLSHGLTHSMLEPSRLVRPLEEAAKRENGSGAVAAGGVLAGTGLVMGGIPGVRQPNVLPRKPGEKFIPRMIHHGRGGVLGYRVDIHEKYNHDLQTKPVKSAEHAAARAGKLSAEAKMIPGLKKARTAGNAVALGGAGLVLLGAHHHHEVTKKDNSSAQAAVGGGGALAGIGHYGNYTLKRRAGGFEAQARHNTSEAVRLAGKPEAARHAALAGIQTHYADEMHMTRGLVRRVRTPGLVLASLGTGVLVGNHKKVEKAAWKSWYPVPPGVKKIPRKKIGITGDLHWTEATVGGRKAGGMRVENPDSKPVIGTIGVHPGFRRRGVGEQMLAAHQARLGRTVSHDTMRSDDGEAFARATGRKLGGDVPTRDPRWGGASKPETWRGPARRVSERSSMNQNGIRNVRQKGQKVKKSFVPGVGYKAVTALTHAERETVAAYRGARGVLETRGEHASEHVHNEAARMLSSFKRNPSAHKQVTFGDTVPKHQQEKVLRAIPKKLKHPVHVETMSAARSKFGYGAVPEGARGLMAAGTKRTPHTVFLDAAADEHTAAHEFTHAARKKGPNRMVTIVNDYKKLGREEGRADAGAARAGFTSNVPYGGVDYADTAALHRDAESGNRLARFGRKVTPEPLFDHKEYSGVRAKMGQPTPPMRDDIKSQLERHRSEKRKDTAFRVIQHPLTPPAAILGGYAVAQGIKAMKGKPKESAIQQKMKAVEKADPLKIAISDDDAKRLVGEHGLTGPLPKHLDREQRRAAYEARYVTAGGHKAQKWQHRAQAGDKVKTAGLLGATAGSAVWTASRLKGGKLIPKVARGVMTHHKVVHGAETAIGVSATAGGAGELYAAHARRKRSSYASAPGGVASGALRRMNAYDAN